MVKAYICTSFHTGNIYEPMLHAWSWPAIGNTDVDRRAGLYPPVPWALVWLRCSVVWPLTCSNISKYREEYQKRSDVFCHRPVIQDFQPAPIYWGSLFQ